MQSCKINPEIKVYRFYLITMHGAIQAIYVFHKNSRGGAKCVGHKKSCLFSTYTKNGKGIFFLPFGMYDPMPLCEIVFNLGGGYQKRFRTPSACMIQPLWEIVFNLAGWRLPKTFSHLYMVSFREFFDLFKQNTPMQLCLLSYKVTWRNISDHFGPQGGTQPQIWCDHFLSHPKLPV